jgi:phosphatidylserine/phosphatidylglycerophosphate/cardiolipin synthase-like enzyme
MNVSVYHNGDDVFVAWKPAGVIEDCRGFALFRKRNGVEEVVSTWVGFVGQEHEPGERRASTNWPIQKYQWTDYMAEVGDSLQYRVVPMVGPDKDNLRPETSLASGWTKAIKLTPQVAPGIEVYFNRGIVAAQWVSRRLGITDTKLQGRKLLNVIDTPGDPFREYLFGPLGKRLFGMLAEAKRKRREVYAALYEFNDKELLKALAGLGKRAHVVLANASAKKKGEDPNSTARRGLKKVDLHNRMCAPRALGHNKFLVICDDKDKPRWIWTGSQNWSKTGLCTQANNSVVLDHPRLAQEYVDQWEQLKDDGDKTPTESKERNSKRRSVKIGDARVGLWFTPTIDQVDLEEARKVVQNAKEGVFFLMFNPGPRGTMLNEIIAEARKGRKGSRLYIRGAINQNPGTTKNPVELFSGKNSVKASYAVTLPAAIDRTTAYFNRELQRSPGAHAMVHSKVVVVDPLGDDPVVITGSHNLGPKASGTNDENLLIIRGAPAVAQAYATNIMAVYNQYRWRFRRQTQKRSRRWTGLVDEDTWQAGYLKRGSESLKEIEFWARA